jgi:hypothetical protein
MAAEEKSIQIATRPTILVLMLTAVNRETNDLKFTCYHIPFRKMIWADAQNRQYWGG